MQHALVWALSGLTIQSLCQDVIGLTHGRCLHGLLSMPAPEIRLPVLGKGAALQCWAVSGPDTPTHLQRCS